MIKQSQSKWSKALPYLVGGVLFLIGGVRLFTRGDMIGAAIFAITAGIAIFTAFYNRSAR